MKARRISRPSSVRIGMFCRFDPSCQAACSDCRLSRCTRPVSGCPSTAARRCRCSSTWQGAPLEDEPRQLVLHASSSSTSAAVDADRVLPSSAGRQLRFSKRIFRVLWRVDVDASTESLNISALDRAAPARYDGTAPPAPGRRCGCRRARLRKHRDERLSSSRYSVRAGR